MPESRIIVRDRRKKRQWSTDNLIQDHWRPILGANGFDLYSLYLKLSNKTDERAFPGYELIQQHLGYSSSTIRNLNCLLVWCGLIHIESGNKFTSNDYYILDVPEATDERIAAIRASALLWNKDKHFVAALCKRLDNWHPLQHWFKRNNSRLKPVVIHPNQMALDMEAPQDGSQVTDESGSQEAEQQGDTPGTHPTNSVGAPANLTEPQAPVDDLTVASRHAPCISGIERDDLRAALSSPSEDDDFGTRRHGLCTAKTTTSHSEDDDFGTRSRTIRSVQSEPLQSEMYNQQQQQHRAQNGRYDKNRTAAAAAAAVEISETQKHVKKVLERAGFREPAPQELAQRGIDLMTALEWAYWVESEESGAFSNARGYAVSRLRQNPNAEPDGIREVHGEIEDDPDRLRCMGKCAFCAKGGEFDQTLEMILSLEQVTRPLRPAAQRKHARTRR